MARLSCIIAAFNEEVRIGNVLGVVSTHPLVDEIIVVDDGSQDKTADVAGAFKNVKLIVHPRNRGKSAAIHSGIKASSGEFVFLLDADLIGITAEDITLLLEPVLARRADVSISLRGNSPRLWRVIGLDYISGERVLPRKIVFEHIDEILTLPGYGLEVFLNRLIIRNRCRVKVVPWPNVASPAKYKKYGWWSGVRRDLRMIADIARTISLFGPVYQIVRILNLRVE